MLLAKIQNQNTKEETIHWLILEQINVSGTRTCQRCSIVKDQPNITVVSVHAGRAVGIFATGSNLEKNST